MEVKNFINHEGGIINDNSKTFNLNNKGLTLNEYQKKAMETCMPSCDNFSYMFIGLVGELGEFASKMAKGIRKNEVGIGFPYGEVTMQNHFTFNGDDIEKNKEFLKSVKGELGDIAWFIAGLCHDFGWTLEEVCKDNLDKLASRKERGVIDGNGDNR